ncbi:hypothetical protein [Variovorax ginsengisoli]|uniref:Phage protein n=1 Tax=Variovorax ginsengisoli TaxID=363844 RepID=A0ABT9SE23_9BURK|nr:hypothetical protein [Variovorax ginsengisoli]MDP9902616.1 hypothetical protein [Variovorax ginsengisoli]
MDFFDPSILFPAFKAAGMLARATRLQSIPVVDIDVGFVQPDGLILGDAVQTTDIEIEYVTSSVVPPLRVGEALRIKGQAYRVRMPPQRKADGYFTRTTLETTSEVGL